MYINMYMYIHMYMYMYMYIHVCVFINDPLSMAVKVSEGIPSGVLSLARRQY